MFSTGEVVDGKYIVRGVCSSSGGMGKVLFVSSVLSPNQNVVLKYCNLPDEDGRSRFRREVRVMQMFNGNSHIAPVIDANLDYDPPYFVMPHFEYGDLTNHYPALRENLENAEYCFNRMIDCIEQLHRVNVYHRDIKPQNFLVGSSGIVVSDLGLCRQLDSSTAFTHASIVYGTDGYIPPEFFHDGGFSRPDAAGDIFMLGAAFSAILCGYEKPIFARGAIQPSILAVIERACAEDKTRRYQTLAELRQSLQLAFNVVLGRRVSGSTGLLPAQQAIVDRWKSTGYADVTEISQYIEELATLSPQDQLRACLSAPIEAFQAMSSVALPPGQLGRFIEIYRAMSQSAEYGWSFAEVIAYNMSALFNSPWSSEADKAEALETAIIAAIRQNRFAAMDTCKVMIASVADSGLGQRVYEIMMRNGSSFMENIDLLDCRSPAVQAAIVALKERTANQLQALSSGNSFPFGPPISL